MTSTLPDDGLGLARRIIGNLADRVPEIGAGVVLLGVVGAALMTTVGGAIGIAVTIGVFTVIMAVLYYVTVIHPKHPEASIQRPPLPPPANTLILAHDGLTSEQRDAASGIVESAAADVASTLKVSAAHVRGNVFGTNEAGMLRIITDFSCHMEHPPERSMMMPIGQGSTGRAWQRHRPNIAVRREDWGDDVLADDQMGRIEPNLRWIISVPVFTGRPEDPPTWVLNVDGLHEERTAKDLAPAVGVVMQYAEAMSRLLRGTRQ